MTEREKAIEEMAFCKECIGRCYKRDETRMQQDGVDVYRKYCGVWIVVNRLYDTGYRKADEVRREERKTLLNRIRNMYKETGNCINYETFVFIRELAKEFGVEVEE